MRNSTFVCSSTTSSPMEIATMMREWDYELANGPTDKCRTGTKMNIFTS